MECPSCGSENKPDAAFCMSCGAPLPDVPFSQLKAEAGEGRKETATRKSPGVVGEGAGLVPSSGDERSGEPSTEKPQAAGSRPMGRTPPLDETLVMPASAGKAPEAGPVNGGETALPGPQVASGKGFVFGATAATQAQPTPPPPIPTPTPPPTEMRSVVEEIGAPATPPPAPTPAPPIPTPTPPPTEMRSVVEEIGASATPPPAPTPAPPIPTPTPLPTTTVPPAAPTPPLEPPDDTYYIPPEADYGMKVPGEEPPRKEESPAVEQVQAAQVDPSLESTQMVAPVIQPAVAERERRVICPECYAPNPEGNAFCQECGSPIPLTGIKQAASARPAPARQPAGQTAVLATAAPAGADVLPGYSGVLPKVQKARGDKSFGVADILALVGVGAAAMAIALSYVINSFAWKKGTDIGMFMHQGSFTQGRTDLLGGPGILPYQGTEFLTIGLLVAVGLALAVVFLAVRVGRGPMYVLAGCILVLPLAYIVFQAILPLRQMGIDIQPAVGLRGMLFGNEANVGVGLSLWIISGAGALLILAGFLAPPRGWGRLFTFMVFIAIVLGVAFFCAACYNWNLFITEPAASSLGGHSLLERVATCMSVLLH
jgi:hypothetical protein